MPLGTRIDKLNLKPQEAAIFGEVKGQCNDLKEALKQITPEQLIGVIKKNFMKDGKMKSSEEIKNSPAYTVIVQMTLDLLNINDVELNKRGGIDGLYGKTTTNLVNQLKQGRGIPLTGNHEDQFFEKAVQALGNVQEQASTSLQAISGSKINVMQGPHNIEVQNENHFFQDYPSVGDAAHEDKSSSAALDSQLNTLFNKSRVGDITLTFGAGTNSTNVRFDTVVACEPRFNQKKEEIKTMLDKATGTLPNISDANRAALLTYIDNCKFGSDTPNDTGGRPFRNQWLLGLRNLEVVKYALINFNKLKIDFKKINLTLNHDATIDTANYSKPFVSGYINGERKQKEDPNPNPPSPPEPIHHDDPEKPDEIEEIGVGDLEQILCCNLATVRNIADSNPYKNIESASFAYTELKKIDLPKIDFPSKPTPYRNHGDFMNTEYTDSNGKQYRMLGSKKVYKRDAAATGIRYKEEGGHVILGQFTSGQVNGKVGIHYGDGSYFGGEMTGGKKEGHGNFFALDGSVYSGDWKADKKEGNGSYKTPKGDIYNGSRKNDQMHGSVDVRYTNGAQEIIHYNQGKKEHSTYQEQVGSGEVRIFESDYDNNEKRSGQGRFRVTPGDTVDVIYQNDVMTQLVINNGSTSYKMGIQYDANNIKLQESGSSASINAGQRNTLSKFGGSSKEYQIIDKIIDTHETARKGTTIAGISRSLEYYEINGNSIEYNRNYSVQNDQAVNNTRTDLNCDPTTALNYLTQFYNSHS